MPKGCKSSALAVELHLYFTNLSKYCHGDSVVKIGYTRGCCYDILRCFGNIKLLWVLHCFMIVWCNPIHFLGNMIELIFWGTSVRRSPLRVVINGGWSFWRGKGTSEDRASKMRHNFVCVFKGLTAAHLYYMTNIVVFLDVWMGSYLIRNSLNPVFHLAQPGKHALRCHNWAKMESMLAAWTLFLLSTDTSWYFYWEGSLH